MGMTVSELLAHNEDGGAATPEDVAKAEAEEVEAARLVEALEDRVRDGADDITPEQIEQQRSLSRFARLRAEATRRKAEKTARAARLRACVALREEIEGFTADSGTELAGLLRKAQQAVEAFTAAVEDRNATVGEWHRRAKALGIPAHNNPLVRIPAAEHGHLGLVGGVDGGRHGAIRGTLAAGERRIATEVSADYHIDALLAALRSHAGARDEQLGQLYDRLGGIDATAPHSKATHFYRGPGGAIIGCDKPYDAGDIKRLGLKAISRKEAEQA